MDDAWYYGEYRGAKGQQNTLKFFFWDFFLFFWGLKNSFHRFNLSIIAAMKKILMVLYYVYLFIVKYEINHNNFFVMNSSWYEYIYYTSLTLLWRIRYCIFHSFIYDNQYQICFVCFGTIAWSKGILSGYIPAAFVKIIPMDCSLQFAQVMQWATDNMDE